MVRAVEFETKTEDDLKVICLGEPSTEPTKVEGVWDLAAYGVAVYELERLYRRSKGLPLRERKLPSRTGLYIHDEEKTMVFEVLKMSLNISFKSHGTSDLGIEHESSSTEVGQPETERSKEHKELAEEVSELIMSGFRQYSPVIKERIHSFYSALELPEQGILVIRRNELLSFEKKHLGGSIKAELAPTERASSYQIIAVLAAMANLDVSTPYKADEVIRKEAAKYGLALPASPETVVKFLAGPNRKKR